MFLRGDFEVQRVEYNGIPCLHAAPTHTAEAMPAVILLHGWGGEVADYQFFAEMLVLSGRHVIVPEVPNHGERKTIENHFVPDAYGQYWNIVTQGTEEVSAVVDALVSVKGIDGARIDIVGHSMGGMIAGAAFARDSRLQRLCMINSAADWQGFEEWARRENGSPEMADHLRATLQAYEPMQFAESIAPRPVYLMHGKSDSIVPSPYLQSFYEKLLPLYEAHPDRLVWEADPRLNHFITMGILQRLVTWLQANGLSLNG